jgi:hypothetical protein
MTASSEHNFNKNCLLNSIIEGQFNANKVHQQLKFTR